MTYGLAGEMVGDRVEIIIEAEAICADWIAQPRPR